MNEWDILGLVAAFLTSIAFIPQIVKGIKTRKMNDVSAKMLYVLGIGLSLWFLYGYHLGDLIIMAANLFGLLCVVITLILKFRYSK